MSSAVTYSQLAPMFCWVLKSSRTQRFYSTYALATAVENNIFTHGDAVAMPYTDGQWQYLHNCIGDMPYISPSL